MENSSFSERLKAAMEAKNLKQVDLIKAAQQKNIKLGKSQISQYVSGKTIPRENILKVLADILEVQAEYLGGNSDIEPVAGEKQQMTKTEGQSADAELKGERKMREFKKSSKLDNVLYEETSGFVKK